MEPSRERFRISFARREQQALRPLYVISGVPGSLSPLYVIGRVKATASRLRHGGDPLGRIPGTFMIGVTLVTLTPEFAARTGLPAIPPDFRPWDA